MQTLVLKFGGAAVATPECFSSIARIIEQRRRLYPRIAIVISAMGTTTDDLLKLARQVHPNPPRREVDMLISVGERISIALLAMALDLKGIQAISFTGSQSGIITSDEHSDARVIDVRPWRLFPHLEEGRIVIVAGFQGVSKKGEITTLGRGGSDTTAVALAVALHAEKVEFYKDVPGICDVDPKENLRARVFPHLSYEEAIKITENGAKVLHPRCIYIAKKNEVPLQILSFHEMQNVEAFFECERLGTWIGGPKGMPRGDCIYEEEVADLNAMSTV
ncbi:MAG: aspartate kinase [Simkania sp.]|nr:aspartate kinase [Simkania sp.]